MVLSESLLEQIAQRAGDGQGYQELQKVARGAKWCTRPIRLSDELPIPGHPKTPSSGSKPSPSDYEGIYMKACGTRRRTLCKSCSEIYQGDARQLIRAGLRGGKGVPEEVSTHPAIFATLTAPSFGQVHRLLKRDDQSLPCHLSGSGICPHGRSLRCVSVHQDSDEIVGSPICPECYHYKAAVIWNSSSTKLWQRTTIYLRRSLAKLEGITIKELSGRVRISYAKVIEYQRRGLIHLHIVIRCDDPHDRSLPPPASITAERVALALQIAISRVKIKLDRDGEAQEITWGRQIDVRSIDAASKGAVANYIAKYATKSASDSGGLDRRFRDQYSIEAATVPKHLRQMAMTAWELGQDPGYIDLNLAAWAHDLGHRGHFLTKSRQFSATFSYLRQIRQSWSEAQEQGEEADPRFVTEEKLHFAGQGWMFACDAYLVARQLCDHNETRVLAREQITEELVAQGVPT